MDSASLAQVTGTFDNSSKVNELLRIAQEKCHLISPATACPRLPPGCVVGLNVVPIVVANDSHDVGAGKRGLLRTALLRLANAAGIQWLGSTRIDPGTDPYYVHWHATGVWRSLDGTWLPVVGDCQMDLRNGSAQVAKILESARATEKRSAEEVGRVQLRDTRAKILEHAQSKAECRGIRKALAIRSYTERELSDKPFVVARMMWVGNPNDPQDRAAIRDSFLNGIGALMGSAGRPALPPAMTYAMPTAEVPPVGSVPDSDGVLPDDDEPTVAPPFRSYDKNQCGGKDSPPTNSAAVPPPAQAAGAPPASPKAPLPASNGEAGGSAVGSREPSGFTIPGGREKGTSIEDCSDESLTWWTQKVADGLANGGDPRFADKNARFLTAMKAEQKRREMGSVGGSGTGDGDDGIPF